MIGVLHLIKLFHQKKFRKKNLEKIKFESLIKSGILHKNNNMKEYLNRLTSTKEVKEINRERFKRVKSAKDQILPSTISIERVREDNKLIAAHIKVNDPNDDISNPFLEWYLKYFIYIHNVNNIKEYFNYPWFLKINLI